jgi:hypothetical protein
MSIRHTEPEQYRYFLGDEFEGVPAGGVGSGAQPTPPRQHIVAQVDALLPRAPTALPGKSGHGAWAPGGLGCNVFRPRDGGRRPGRGSMRAAIIRSPVASA